MSPADWNTIYKMSQDKALYTNLINSLFPTIHGNEEVKRGILLMLFGGVGKSTGEGTSLRGDINVCIVGDPSTAKSQLLKQSGYAISCCRDFFALYLLRSLCERWPLESVRKVEP